MNSLRYLARSIAFLAESQAGSSVPGAWSAGRCGAPPCGIAFSEDTLFTTPSPRTIACLPTGVRLNHDHHQPLRVSYRWIGALSWSSPASPSPPARTVHTSATGRAVWHSRVTKKENKFKKLFEFFSTTVLCRQRRDPLYIHPSFLATNRAINSTQQHTRHLYGRQRQGIVRSSSDLA
jgi:hypothetical protein